MLHRGIVFTLLFSAGLFGATPNTFRSFNEGRQLGEADAVRLESALSSSPDDMDTRAQLLGFYVAKPDNDAAWTNRLRLLSWTIEHHPESEVMSFPGLWTGMPDPMFQQVKPQWIAQVHQHADDPNVLRSAAAFLISKNAPPVPNAVRVGANVQAVNLAKKVDPAYPPLAQQARVQGTVKFNATIGQDGHIMNLALVSGHPLLVQAAQEAVQQWVYKPTLLNGNPVQVTTTIDVNFTLQP
jgi:TonB family protein